MTAAVPWCESCSRFVDPSPPESAQQCSVCGGTVSAPEDEPAVPWHFKLLVLATAAYLAFRALQGVLWLLARL